MLKPLGDRVLIKPHENPNETESGLILPENRSDRFVEMQGTVIAVGTPKHPMKTHAEAVAFELMNECNIPESPHARGAKLLQDLVRREPCVKPGDDVLFSWNVGQEVTVDDETYLLLRESDLLAILEPDPA